MTRKINQIIEYKDGRVFTVTQCNDLPSKLPTHLINYLVSEGMDREEATNLVTAPRHRLERAPHLETDVPVDDTTNNLINQIRNKK